MQAPIVCESFSFADCDRQGPRVANPESPESSSALATLRTGERGRVLRVLMPVSDHGHDRQLVLRLLEIGFVPGEEVRVTATGPGGREPLAVRVAGTTFALRRHEAEHVIVERLS
jgi:ferrous iron transport protein A